VYGFLLFWGGVLTVLVWIGVGLGLLTGACTKKRWCPTDPRQKTMEGKEIMVDEHVEIGVGVEMDNGQ
jgi:hypothetical protein